MTHKNVHKVNNPLSIIKKCLNFKWIKRAGFEMAQDETKINKAKAKQGA